MQFEALMKFVNQTPIVVEGLELGEIKECNETFQSPVTGNKIRIQYSRHIHSLGNTSRQVINVEYCPTVKVHPGYSSNGNNNLNTVIVALPRHLWERIPLFPQDILPKFAIGSLNSKWRAERNMYTINSDSREDAEAIYEELIKLFDDGTKPFPIEEYVRFIKDGENND